MEIDSASATTRIVRPPPEASTSVAKPGLVAARTRMQFGLLVGAALVLGSTASAS